MSNYAYLAWSVPNNASYQKLATDFNLKTLAGRTARKVPLVEDVQLDISSDFDRASSVLPSVSAVDTLFKLQNAGAGQTTLLQGMFDLMIWKKTNPVRFNLSTAFFPRTNPVKDVLLPVISLMGLTVLTDNGTSVFDTPGISLANLSQFINGSTDAQQALVNQYNSGQTNKVLSIKIPGIISLDKALVTSAKPTFSKETTDDGVPLWCKMDLFIQSVLPATDKMLQAELNRKNTTALAQIASFLG